jgi:hypothetical protein
VVAEARVLGAEGAAQTGWMVVKGGYPMCQPGGRPAVRGEVLGGLGDGLGEERGGDLLGHVV